MLISRPEIVMEGAVYAWAFAPLCDSSMQVRMRDSLVLCAKPFICQFTSLIRVRPAYQRVSS